MTNKIYVPRINVNDVEGLFLLTLKTIISSYLLAYFIILPLWVCMIISICFWLLLLFKEAPLIVESEYEHVLEELTSNIISLENEKKDFIDVIELAKKKVTSLKEEVTFLKNQVTDLQYRLTSETDESNYQKVTITKLQAQIKGIERDYAESRAGYVNYVLGRLRKMKQTEKTERLIEKFESERSRLPNIDYVFNDL